LQFAALSVTTWMTLSSPTSSTTASIISKILSTVLINRLKKYSILWTICQEIQHYPPPIRIKCCKCIYVNMECMQLLADIVIKLWIEYPI
jgi:hypothetical protein